VNGTINCAIYAAVLFRLAVNSVARGKRDGIFNMGPRKFRCKSSPEKFSNQVYEKSTTKSNLFNLPNVE